MGEVTVCQLLLIFLMLAPYALAADRWSFGLTSSGSRMEALVIPGPSASAPVVLLVGGLQGTDETTNLVQGEVEAFKRIAQEQRRFKLLAIPVANPDAVALQFPPSGIAYRENAEANALWRWIGVQAPDLVVIAGRSDFNLAVALAQNDVAGLGKIPSMTAIGAGVLQSLPSNISRSDARREADKRRSRSARQFAEELAQTYGKDFEQVNYLPGMSVIAQLRLSRVAEVTRLVAPYLDGTKESLLRPNSLTLAGHLVFAAYAERTEDPRSTALVRKAADLGFSETGEMKESMPFHDEMSDSVFMAVPLLAKAGKLTGERRYFDMAARHFFFMQKLVLRTDGLYRHSPLAEAAWGRGNAFPALGLALALSDFPRDHPEFGRMLEAFRQHMAVLSRFQDEGGMWREVVDHPGAYAEYSATAMIATAFLRGIRNGWLEPASFQPSVDRAWQGILVRTGADGRLVDVCESTGKQRSLNDYLRRAAIFNVDARGGGMALIFATEMAGLP